MATEVAQPLVVSITATALRAEIAPVNLVTETQAIGRAVVGATQTATIKPA